MVNADAAIFLDRDGVLVRTEVIDGKAYAARTLDAFRLLPGSARSVERLKQAGFRVIVATNQPDIGHGLVDAAIVTEMHERLVRRTGVDDIFCCPHIQTAGCSCRKPRPGMLRDAARKWDLDLSRCWMVGDRASDVEAGIGAGCKTVFIDRGYREAPPKVADGIVSTLPKAVDFIIRSQG